MLGLAQFKVFLDQGLTHSGKGWKFLFSESISQGSNLLKIVYVPVHGFFAVVSSFGYLRGKHILKVILYNLFLVGNPRADILNISPCGKISSVKLVYSFRYLQRVLLLSPRIKDTSSWVRAAP